MQESAASASTADEMRRWMRMGFALQGEQVQVLRRIRRRRQGHRDLDADDEDDGLLGDLWGVVMRVQAAMGSGACARVLDPDDLSVGVVPSGNPAMAPPIHRSDVPAAPWLG